MPYSSERIERRKLTRGGLGAFARIGFVALSVAAGACVMAGLHAEGTPGGPTPWYVIPELSNNAGLLTGIAAAELALIALTYRLCGRAVQRYARGERDARQHEAFAIASVNALPTHLATLNDQGIVVAANTAWREFGRAIDDKGIDRCIEGPWRRVAIGDNCLALCDEAAGRGDKDAAAFAAGVRTVMRGQAPQFQMEYAAHLPGERRWFIARVRPFAHEGSEAPSHVVVAHDDITQRVLAEEATQKARKDAENANEAKSAFLANMSHEIRTPMTAILGYSEMLLAPDQTADDRHKCVHTIRRNSEHLLAVINDILDISKIEASKMTVESVMCDLPQIIADVFSLTQPRAIEKGLKLKVELDGAIPRRVQTDPLRVKQVLVNLVGNAIKFTKTGAITLRLSRQISYFTQSVKIDVCDTGIGMTPVQMDRLFQPFTQADNSTTRKFGGTGLGLTISRRLANLLGGDIVVQSAEGQGSTFSLTFAAGNRENAELIEKLDELDVLLAVPKTAEKAPLPRLRGTILLAEDGEDNQDLLSSHLRDAGAEVVIAANGRIAMELASQKQFDLIFMDMQMPEMDGYSATRAIRATGNITPIIALTANAMAEDRAKCITAGCNDFLGKPVDRHKLIETAGCYLRKSTAVHDVEPDRSKMTATSTVGTDPKFRKLLDKFIARLPERVNTLASHLHQENLAELERALHQLKGAGHGYGFSAITESAARAEQAIRGHAETESIRASVLGLIELIRSIDGYDRTREGHTQSEAA